MCQIPLKKTLFLSVTALFFIVVIPAICLADARSIFKKNNNAVVIVIANNEKGEAISQGSGFIVRHDGMVVTNYHVVSNASSLTVKGAGKSFDVRGLMHLDKENDLVILKIDANKLPSVRLGDAEKAGVGEKVYVISSPRGLENTISEGILSGIRAITEKRKILQITALISPGSSGGPVFNGKGEVIGIATFLLKDSQGLNFAMPVNHVKDKISNQKVISLKESGLEDYRNSAERWFALGFYYSESGKYREATDAFRQSIRLKPDRAEAHNNLGVAYDKLGMYREAIDAYMQALRLKPDDASTYNNLGLAYSSSGMHNDATDAFKRAISLKPDYAEAYTNLGVTCEDLGMRRDAMEMYKKALRLKPDHTRALYNLGRLYLLNNDRGSALDIYKTLRNLNTQLADRLFNMIYK
jgi:Flp pilus assembly protein TadD